MFSYYVKSLGYSAGFTDHWSNQQASGVLKPVRQHWPLELIYITFHFT